LVVGLHLHALAEIHQRLVDLAGLCQCSAGSLCIASTFRSSQIDDGECAARPRTLSLGIALLDLYAKEPMASRAHGVASRTSNFALRETSLQDHHGLFKTATYDLGETSHNLTLWALFCALEQQCPALDAGVLVLHGHASQKVEDAVIVDFVHGYDNRVFGGAVGRYDDIGD